MHGVSAESKSRPPDRGADHWTHAAAGSQPASQGPGDNGHIQPAVTLITASLMPSLMHSTDYQRAHQHHAAVIVHHGLSVVVGATWSQPGPAGLVGSTRAHLSVISAAGDGGNGGLGVLWGWGQQWQSESQQCGSEP
jgi:hypothetical protein